MSETTTGRPVRALTLIIAALAGWAAARLPEAMARQHALAASLAATPPQPAPHS